MADEADANAEIEPTPDAAVVAGGVPEAAQAPWYQDFGDEWKDKDPVEAARHFRDQHQQLHASYEDKLSGELEQAVNYGRQLAQRDPDYIEWRKTRAQRDKEAAEKAAAGDKPWLELPEYDRSWDQYEQEVDDVQKVRGPDGNLVEQIVGKKRVWTGDPELQAKYRAAQKHRSEFSDQLLHKFPEVFQKGFEHHFEKAFESAWSNRMQQYQEEQELNQFERDYAHVLYVRDENKNFVVDPTTGKALWSQAGILWSDLANSLMAEGVKNKRKAMLLSLPALKERLGIPQSSPARAAKADVEPEPEVEPVDSATKNRNRARDVAARTASRGGQTAAARSAPPTDDIQEHLTRNLMKAQKARMAGNLNN